MNPAILVIYFFTLTNVPVKITVNLGSKYFVSLFFLCLICVLLFCLLLSCCLVFFFTHL